MPDFSMENKAQQESAISPLLIAGLDEAGRGAWAGPVVSAAVILDPNKMDHQIDDSKKVPPSLREKLFDFICKNAIAYAIGMCSAMEIDQLNILEATKFSMVRALKNISPKPDYLLIDALTLPHSVGIPQQKIIKGDSISYSIAAASIVAKVVRDRIMKRYALRYPNYNFAAHKGYGTATHRRILNGLGACEIHRFSYKPIERLKKPIL